MKYTKLIALLFFSACFSCKKADTPSNTKTVACFTYASSDPTTNDAVTFDASCSQNVTNYYWYIDNVLTNAGNSQLKSFSKNFNSGSHVVSLVVKGTGSNPTDSMQVSFKTTIKPITQAFSFNYEGMTWNPLSSNISAYNTGGGISISVDEGANGNSFSTMLDGDSAATYTVDYNSHQNVTVFTTPPNNYYIMMNGSITITNVNNVYAKGSFTGNFENMNTRVDSLGQGTFQVNFK